jgi:hypothetical protein
VVSVDFGEEINFHFFLMGRSGRVI